MFPFWSELWNFLDKRHLSSSTSLARLLAVFLCVCVCQKLARLLPSTKCLPTGDEVSDPTSCDMGAKGSHVVAFFKRAVTCAGIIMLISLFRVMFRSVQMFCFPDAPPPADMAFPSWVLVSLDPFGFVCNQCSSAHIFR
jgi:hypothetical protein